MSGANIQSIPVNNPRYHYSRSSQKLELQTTAETVSYNIAEGSTLSDINLSFTLEPEGNFLDRAVVLKFPKVPLKFTRTTAIDGTAGAKTLADFFNNYDIICMRQFGILNAISNVKVQIDGKLQIVNSDLGRTLNIVSQSYDPALVHQWFQASRPDLFAEYMHYSSSFTTIKVVSEGGDPMDIRRPIFADSSIFNNISDQYSSRIPFMTSSTALVGTSTVADVELLDQKCLIPFNLFGVPTDAQPLYNAKKLIVSITLYGDWWKRIFSLRSTGTHELANIEFRQDKITDFKPRISYIVRTGTNDSIEKATRFYAKKIPIVETSSTLNEYDVDVRELKKVDRLKFDIHTVPKRLILYAKALYSDADKVHLLKEARTADLYGRFETLQITMGNKTTNIANGEASVLYNRAKSNGLNRSYEQAMYLNGFAIPIDVSENLGLEPGTFIGTPGTRNGGSPNLYITCSFRNLAGVKMHYQLGYVVVYQGVLTQENGVWDMLSSFRAPEYSGSLEDIEEDIMHEINVIGGFTDMSGGNAIGTFFSKYLPQVGKGLKNLITAAFNNKDGFRDNIVKTWNGGAFDNHTPFNGGFNQHSTRNNERAGGAYTQQWSTSP